MAALPAARRALGTGDKGQESSHWELPGGKDGDRERVGEGQAGAGGKDTLDESHQAAVLKEVTAWTTLQAQGERSGLLPPRLRRPPAFRTWLCGTRPAAGDTARALAQLRARGSSPGRRLCLSVSSQLIPSFAQER